jgi:hypothetical protein
MRRGWFALCIGSITEAMLLGLGALIRTTPASGHEVTHSWFFYVSLPGFLVQLLAQTAVPIYWSLHPVALQTLSIVGSVLLYAVIAYLTLWLRDCCSSDRIERKSGWFRTRFMRCVWLASSIGLTVAGILLALEHIRVTRAIPNGQAILSVAEAYPVLLTLSFPGIFLIVIAINLTAVMWGSHPVLAQTVVTTGNFVFYSVVAYVVLRLTAGLSARWKHR